MRSSRRRFRSTTAPTDPGDCRADQRDRAGPGQPLELRIDILRDGRPEPRLLRPALSGMQGPPWVSGAGIRLMSPQLSLPSARAGIGGPTRLELPTALVSIA